jgi:hypothetical protein
LALALEWAWALVQTKDCLEWVLVMAIGQAYSR